MKTKKVTFKFFDVMDYEKEAAYLSQMHSQGWKLSYVTLPGIYHFVRTTPAQVCYQLDYNRDSQFEHDSYVQMFEDCGWEYLFDFVQYSYFRKPVEMMDGDEQIFCDDESRFDMMQRVFKGRIIPLIVIFACLIIPQMLLSLFRTQSGDMGDATVFALFVIMAALYVAIFVKFAIQFYRFKKKLGR